MGWRDYHYYPKSTPIRKEGGIKAKGGHKLGGERWWAKRWIAVLEGFNLGARLTRGRSYARGGQVLSIDIAPGLVTAKVQGSRQKPYKITITLAPLEPRAWDRVIAELAGRAIFLAKLLGGEMPADIEEVFQAAGTPLFPTRSRDLVTDCSCPDWSNPCKHIAAVFYLLGEEFDRDPFLIFSLRGLPREALLDRLRANTGTVEPEASSSQLPLEPLVTDPAAFWSCAPLPDESAGGISSSPVTAPLLRRVGDFPFWRGSEPLLSALSPRYAAAAERSRELILRFTPQDRTGILPEM